jgi:glycosyltransferase involved in cell wall biosynthesis
MQTETRPAPIAYIAQKFPGLTITFIYREIMALRARGMAIATFSTWKPSRAELSPESVGLIDDTFYLFPLHLPSFLGAHLYYLATRPARYFGALRFLLRQAGGGMVDRVRSAYHFAEAVYLAREMGKQGVRHVHAGFASHPATLAMTISRLNGISFSFAAHAYGIFVDSLLLKEKLAAARFIIASTQYNKDYLTAHFPGVDADKIKVIYHGVSLQDFRPRRSGENGVPVILSVAQFREKKGLPFLVEACAILKREGHAFECCVVGDGAQRGHLEALIDRHGLRDTVRLKGIVFQEKLRDCYRRADILALPSVVADDGDRDGIPVTLIEAMATGCPVVSTLVSGIPELVENGRTGLLVPPGDPAALARALGTLLQDKGLRQRMGQASRDRVVRKFDIEDSVAQVADLFLEELGGRNRS